ncbi:MAG: leucine-rich repeat protein, partial [Kiritimatiellae bacterium]|nr:leucine-rich repeat protein [Kiritimatiellia bacterium]
KWDKLKGATLYARWTTAKYTVTLDNQGATTKGTTSVTAALGASLPQIEVPTKTGYTFAGYFAEPNGKGTKYYYSSGKGAVKWDQTANATLYARWTTAKTVAKLAAKLGSTADQEEAEEPEFEIEEGVLVAVEPNGLTEIEAPDTVTIIGEAAFVGCTEVRRVVLPETVTTIGDFAFFGCAALEELVLPTGELEVSATAFIGCQGLADDSGTITIDGVPFDCRNPLE